MYKSCVRAARLKYASTLYRESNTDQCAATYVISSKYIMQNDNVFVVNELYFNCIKKFFWTAHVEIKAYITPP